MNKQVVVKLLKNTNIMDLHCHTIWSDGIDTADEIVKNAIKYNIQVVGISDHYKSYTGKHLNIKAYAAELCEIKKKYNSEIKVLIGIEINPFPFPKEFEELEYKYFDKLDYVLIENLEYSSSKLNLSDLSKYINRFNCLVGIAHTDLYRWSGGKDLLSELFEFLKSNNIFVEINSNSVHCDIFDKILYGQDEVITDLLYKYKIPVIVGSDTHDLGSFEFHRLCQANKIAGNSKNWV